MVNHCFKLHQLTAGEVNGIKRRMERFTKRGVKVTILKQVVYIHLQEHQKYDAIANLLIDMSHFNKLQTSAKNMAWLKQWRPDFK